MPIRDVVVPLVVAGVLVAGAVAWTQAGHAPSATHAVARPVQVDTAHYTLYSYATPEQTHRVAQAVEALHAAYGRVFAERLASQPHAPRMQMVLYATRSQFKAHNRSSPWAEAFYAFPRCHAYYDDGARNPYHWMVHEATHQLNNEWARLRMPKWIDEGVAAYFATSRLADGTLHPGAVDPDTYPTWWLPRMWFSGDLDQDLAAGRLIPLHALVTGTGPDINQNVNLYYVEYWSLAHFLFEHDHGRYAAGFRKLMATDGSIDDFERLVGPVEVVQRAWYAHLLQLRDAVRSTQAISVRIR